MDVTLEQHGPGRTMTFADLVPGTTYLYVPPMGETFPVALIEAQRYGPGWGLARISGRGQTFQVPAHHLREWRGASPVYALSKGPCEVAPAAPRA